LNGISHHADECTSRSDTPLHPPSSKASERTQRLAAPSPLPVWLARLLEQQGRGEKAADDRVLERTQID